MCTVPPSGTCTNTCRTPGLPSFLPACLSGCVPRYSQLRLLPSRVYLSSFPFPLFRPYAVPNCFAAATHCTTNQQTPHFCHHPVAPSAAAATTVAPASPARAGLSRACKQQSPLAIVPSSSEGGSCFIPPILIFRPFLPFLDLPLPYLTIPHTVVCIPGRGGTGRIRRRGHSVSEGSRRQSIYNLLWYATRCPVPSRIYIPH